MRRTEILKWSRRHPSPSRLPHHLRVGIREEARLGIKPVVTRCLIVLVGGHVQEQLGSDKCVGGMSHTPHCFVEGPLPLGAGCGYSRYWL